MKSIGYALMCSSVVLLGACSSGGKSASSKQASTSSVTVSSMASSSSVAAVKGGTFTLSLKEATVTRGATGEVITIPASGINSGESTIE